MSKRVNCAMIYFLSPQYGFESNQQPLLFKLAWTLSYRVWRIK